LVERVLGKDEVSGSIPLIGSKILILQRCGLNAVANSEREARLDLARKLRESADSSSEQELRNALSRSYYSIYHAARIWVGREQGGLSHDGLERAVRQRDPQLAEDLKELYRLRENADYNAQMLSRDYESDIERFRLAVNQALDKARTVYRRICDEIERGTGAK
jgi:uncharacterized protein (UPF0332 family)